MPSGVYRRRGRGAERLDREAARKVALDMIRERGAVIAPDLIAATGMESRQLLSILGDDIAAWRVEVTNVVATVGSVRCRVRRWRWIEGAQDAPDDSARALVVAARSAAMRTCLCCRQAFYSEHAGNRRCPRCVTRPPMPYGLGNV